MTEPQNSTQAIQRFPNKDIISYIQEKMPDWIIQKSDKFSKELHAFNIQWTMACDELNVIPKEILIVTDTFVGIPSHPFAAYSIKKLSERGYIVLPAHTFATCERCKNIIPSLAAYERKNIAHKFTGRCTECTN